MTASKLHHCYFCGRRQEDSVLTQRKVASHLGLVDRWQCRSQLDCNEAFRARQDAMREATAR